MRTHNNAVDGNDFTEDDGYQVLCADPWRLNSSSKYTGAGVKDTPVHSMSAMMPAILEFCTFSSYQAAPTTLSPMHRPMPIDAHAYGDVSSRNFPTYILLVRSSFVGNCKEDV